MGKGPFKMKGSPMQRNFGIGSPLHDERTLLQKARDEAKQIWEGVKGTAREMASVTTGGSEPKYAFEQAYGEEEEKQKTERTKKTKK